MEEMKKERDSVQREHAAHARRTDKEYMERIREQRASQQSYAQLILLLGYGGYFTLWIQTRDLMSLWMFGWTGSMLGLSLLAFIAWELIKAWFEGRGMNRLSEGRQSLDDYNTTAIKLNSFWPLGFGVSAAAGLAGGIPLLCWYIYTTVRAAAALPTVLQGN
jgi:hypothetical protein